MKSILLIYPKPEQDKQARFGFSLNLLYLASIVENAGHKVLNYLDYSLNHYSFDELDKNVLKSDYIIVELDAFPLKRSSNVNFAELLIQRIKTKFPKKIIIAFGYDLSLFSRTISHADFSLSADIIEGEILQIIDNNKIKLNYNRNTKSFDLLPFPARYLLSNFIEHGGSYSRPPNLAKSTIMQTSRGCLNSCTFCQRKGWQKQFINHSANYVISEFQHLQEKNYVNIWIADDNFTFDLHRAKNILKQLIQSNITKNMKISCSSWTKIDEEFLDIAKSANISIISFGIESANPEILAFYNKKIDLEKVNDLISYADKIGLYTVGNFIIGAPMETAQTIENTFEYALQTPFDQVNLKILDYMAGSKLFENLPTEQRGGNRHIFACKENGLNNFPINEIKEQIALFKQYFSINRQKRLKNKVKRCGQPYKIRYSRSTI